MRTQLLTATFAFGIAFSGAAQTPSAQAPPAQPPTAAQGAMVTVVGCVTRQQATPQTGAGASTQAAQPQFLLTDSAAPVTPPSTRTDGATPTGTTSRGATPAAGQMPGRKIYVLVPHGDSIDLAAHVNHMVRVTGASTAPQTTSPLAGRSPEALPVPGDTAPAGATGTPFDTSNLPTLAVTAVAMVASTCR